MDYDRQSDFLKAIAHPVRLRILEGLCDHDCFVGKMVDALGMPQSTVSQHLAILKAQGIIAPKKYGVKTCYKIVDGTIVDVFKALGRRQPPGR